MLLPICMLLVHIYKSFKFYGAADRTRGVEVQKWPVAYGLGPGKVCEECGDHSIKSLLPALMCHVYTC